MMHAAWKMTALTSDLVNLSNNFFLLCAELSELFVIIIPRYYSWYRGLPTSLTYKFKNSNFFIPSRPAPGPTQPLTRFVTGAPSLDVKRPERERNC
jgi:hypothetical protein